MVKSATEVMHEVLFAAVVDSVAAFKAASNGVPNTLLRDLNSVHANTTFADLPKELQATIDKSVRAAFTRLLKEGYLISPAGANVTKPSAKPREPAHAPGSRTSLPKRAPPRSNTPPSKAAPKQKPTPGRG
jgi:hypothetical protein